VVCNDTNWIVDGTNLNYFIGDTAYTITYPTYSDTGHIDSLLRIGDTLFAYADFDTSHGHSDHVILIGDAYNQRGIPFEIEDIYDDGTGDERLKLMADTARYAGRGSDDTCGYADGANYVIFQPGAKTYLKALNGKWDYLGHFGNVACATFTLGSHDDGYFTHVREWDCGIYRAKYAWHYYYAKLIKTSDTIRVFIWATEGASFIQSDIDDFDMAFYSTAPFHVAHGSGSDTVVSTAYTIVEDHRRHAIYGGNRDTVNKFSWSSGVSNYDAIDADGERLESDDPITSISSLGQQFVLYRRHGIETVTGYDVADYYKQPIQTDVGAASNYCVARNPLDGSDYFVNEKGLWSFGGGTVKEISRHYTEIFSDSINWDREKYIWAAVYDRKYWLAAPFGTSQSNNRLMAVDLETGDVGFVGGANPSCFLVWREPQFKERLFMGLEDSTALVQIAGDTNDVYIMADWESGWYYGESKHREKRVLYYEIEYNADSLDTIIVDWYTDNSGTAVWADTIAVISDGQDMHYASAGRAVKGYAIGFGIRSPLHTTTGANTRPISIGFEVIDVGARRKQ